jgi:hypothetical protein
MEVWLKVKREVKMEVIAGRHGDISSVCGRSCSKHISHLLLPTKN